MHPFRRSLGALLLVLVCLPVFAGNDCPAIRALNANDVQTGEPVTITWSYSGSGAAQSQTLSGHDFEAPVHLAPGQTSYTYTPSKPGEKHVTLAAVTACGTFSQTAKYHVKQCNVVPPAMTVSATSVAPGDVIQAEVALAPGHTARWEVTNGTASATTGSAISVTAGGAGTVTITAFVSRGSSCAVGVTQSVEVVAACPIVEPMMIHAQQATADQWFYLFLPGFDDPSFPLKATFAVTGAHIEYSDPAYVGFVAPSQGSFTIEVTVTDGTCSRTFARTFTVEACTASAVVTDGQVGECGATTAVANFTGVPPFQGSWSDGQYFFTWDSSLERPIGGGTYTINWVYDANCQGTVSGSAQGSSALPAPYFLIDPIVNGAYWANDTCPGLERVARIEYPANGATVEWTVTNATILSGQGTPEVHFAADGPGSVSVSARYRDANGGCPSPAYTAPNPLVVAGKPEFTITVDRPVIKAGETALVTINYEHPAWVRSMSIFSSLGDSFSLLYGNTWEYRSTTGPGTATITVTAGSVCGETITHTAMLTIEPGGPSAKVQALGSTCGEYYAYAQFSGVPPFRGTWSNGQTFETPYPSEYLWIQEPGTYTLTSFSDSTGEGPVTGSATFNYTALPKPQFTLDTTTVCPNGIATATLTEPLPEGVTAKWYTSYGEIVSGQGTASAQIRALGYGVVWVQLSGPNACSAFSDTQDLFVKTAQLPYISAYGVYEGGSTIFEVRLDPNTTSWGFENSLGDLIEIVENPEPNYYVLRYTSTHGVGTSMIRVYGETSCGETYEWSQPMQIFPALPTVTLTSTPAANCGNDVTATFTGTAPFTGTWFDGQPFSTDTNTVTRHFNNTVGWIALSGTDGNGNWVSSDYLSVPTSWSYHPVSGPSTLCEGTTGTVTTDLPEGWTVNWEAYSGVRIVSGQGTATVTVAADGPEQSAWINATFTQPDGCMLGGGTSIYVREYDVANPVINLPVTSIRAGESFDFSIAFDGNAYEYMRYETSNFDGLSWRGQHGMTFDLTYQSYNGPGTVTIKAYGMTTCGKYVESTATLTITE